MSGQNEKALSLFIAMCRRREDLRTFYASTYKESMDEAIRCVEIVMERTGLDEVQASLEAAKRCADETARQFLLVAPIEMGLRADGRAL